jgi:hypothetical protein
MSLINEALRKAQRDRTPSTMHSASCPPRHVADAAPQAHKRGLLIGLSIGIAGLLGLVAGLAITLFQQQAAPQSAMAEPPQPTPQAVPAPSTAPIQASQAPSAPATSSSATLTAASTAGGDSTSPTSSSEAILSELQQARADAQTQAATDAQSPKGKETIPANQEVINWLSLAQISGVRLSDSGNKVILNNKAYAAGETVHFGLGLKVLIIQQSRVFFIDAMGKKYMKRL